MRTLDGETFDLVRAGFHELLRLTDQAHSPEAAARGPLLTVLAKVEHESQENCKDPYVRQVEVSGHWLRSVGTLFFRADGNSTNGDEAITMKVNGSVVDKDELRTRAADLVEVRTPRTEIGRPVLKKIWRLELLKLTLRFPAVTLGIDWVHRAVPGFAVNHLNFGAFDLGRASDLRVTVGGILGHDDRTWATTLPPECAPQSSDLMRRKDPSRPSRPVTAGRIVAYWGREPAPASGLS